MYSINMYWQLPGDITAVASRTTSLRLWLPPAVFDLTQHHHALADAEACAHIAMKIL